MYPGAARRREISQNLAPPLLPPPSTDEFQKFIHATPTTGAKTGTHWNPINWWIEESQKGNYDTLHLYALIIYLVLLWLRASL